MNALSEALRLIEQLSEEIGPRRPCSQAERDAAIALRDWLCERNVDARLEPFRGYASGGYQAAAFLVTALTGVRLQQRRPMLGAGLVAAAMGVGALEDGLRQRPLTRLLSWQSSQNLVASVAPTDEEGLRVCLCGHMDTTRSGLIFHPALQSHLPALMAVPPAAMGAAIASACIGGRAAKLLRTFARAGLVLALALTAEREIRGVDVPGANDNASGTAVAMGLIAELAAEPLSNTRVDLLISGCEEAWMLGAAAYMDAHANDLQDTIFINFDTVGGDVPLTYVLREGTMTKRDASPRLVALCEGIARERPDLGLKPGGGTAGLPTDATAAMARGYEAITLLARGETGIPNYHWPTDDYSNIESRTVGVAFETGRLLLERLDAEAG